ncbi:MAG: site-2 protease family protein [Planctomycetota bacterium]|nr:site-2 protease family protein [Planctomycetota bacterium]MDW8372680.1 site-2 protease family protein [Planctomycetota bacterium]
MLDLLALAGYAVLALLGFGFVIAIHELGHFVFAKWAGVKVERFSIGFPPSALGLPLTVRPLWRRQVGETEYVIDWIPFGGYVKMLGQEDIPSGEEAVRDPRSYESQRAPWKALILLGGVLFNLVSSYLILLGLVAWGMPVFHPVVGDVEPTVVDERGLRVESPASKLGLARGDRILAIDGERVRSFDDVMTSVVFAGGRPLTVTVERAGQLLTLPAPGAPEVMPVFDGRFGRPSLGIAFPWSNRVVLALDAPPDGLRRFDRVLAVAGEDVRHRLGQDIQDRLLRHFARPVTLTIEREGRLQELTLVYAGDDTAFDTRAGLPVYIADLPAGSPAAAAGLRIGDWVTAVDGVPVSGLQHCLALVRAGLDARGRVAVEVQRAGQRATIEVPARDTYGVLRIGIVPRSLTRGLLEVLPPALDGGPSALARLGLQAGDAIVGWQPAERTVTVHWVRPQAALVLPLGLDAAAWRAANHQRDPGLINRLLGQHPDPPLPSLLSGTRVLRIEPAQVVLAPLAGEPRAVDRQRLGPAGAELQVGDWIADARLGPEGAVLIVARGAGELRSGVLDPPPLGTTIVFEREELPYQAHDWWDRLDLVNDTAYNLVVKTVLLIPRLFRSPEQGGVDPNKALTGPIGIFRELKARAELMGFDSYLKLIALIGLNLFVVNLLPIPITDGGQLLILGLETALRRPLPRRIKDALLYAGAAFVIALFIYICGLDILRWLGLA